MTRPSPTTIALAALLTVGAAAPALAANHDEQEQNLLQGSTVTLAQAIAAAEQQTGGKAYEAGVDVGNGKSSIVVETNGPKGVQTVTVDAQSGQIIRTEAGGQSD